MLSLVGASDDDFSATWMPTVRRVTYSALGQAFKIGTGAARTITHEQLQGTAPAGRFQCNN